MAKKNLYDLRSLNDKIIEHNVTAEYLEEEYGIKRPDRYASNCIIANRAYRVFVSN